MNDTMPHIILMDDDPLLLGLAEDLLRHDFPEYRIETTNSLDGLASLLERDHLGLVVTDYHMKGLTGMDVLRLVKGRHPDCPVVMFTATGDEEIAVEAMKAGLDDYVIKSPGNIQRLSKAVRFVLARTAERQRLREAEARALALTENVLDTSAVGIIVLDAQFRVEWVNKSLERFLGMSREELVGRDKRQLIDARIKHFFEAPEVFADSILKTYAQNDYVLSFDCRVLAGEGREERWLEHRSEPIRNGLWAGGRIEHYYDITDRKRLEEQQVRLASFPQVAPFPILEINAAGSVTFSNPCAARLFPDIDVMGSAHPIVRRAMEAIEELRASGLPSLTREAESGGRTYALQCWPARADDRSRIYALDITERKQAELALQSAKDYAENLLQTANAIVIGLDRDGHIREFNRAAERITGYTKEELAGRQFFEVLSPRERFPHAWDAFCKLTVGGFPKNFENPIVTKSGQERHIVWQNNEVREQGQIAGTVSFGIDITDRKEMENSLRQTNETLSALVESAPLAVVILDGTGCITLWNPAAERMFGWTEAEVLGHPLPFVPPDKQDEHRAIWELALNKQAITGLELLRHKKDGNPIHVSLSTAPLCDKGGRTTGILGLMADITPRKQMEQHAMRVERMAALGQLLGGIAHELKNPLFVLAGRLELMKEKLAAREFDALPSDLDKIQEAAKRMMHVAERFLTMAKPTPAKRASCSVPVLIQQIVDFLANEFMKHHINVVTDMAPDLPAIWSDARLLQEVFLNLMLNAVQAMVAAHGKGTLTVSARLAASPRLPVSASADTGHGEGVTRRQGDTESAASPRLPVSASADMGHGEGVTGGQGDTESAASPRLPVPASADTGHGEGVTGGQGEGERWIEVRIQDDGPGILPEHRPKLFEPFFSTKPANEGTGLGLWTVRTTLAGMNGQVSFEPQEGKGCAFIVRLPVSEELVH